jgi:hypothetical protein
MGTRGIGRGTQVGGGGGLKTWGKGGGLLGLERGDYVEQGKMGGVEFLGKRKN